jgi:hypothetical protein
MRIIDNTISLEELKQMSEKMFARLVKAVVDIDKEIMAVDADLHADEELLMLEHGSEQKNLWGINLYPERFHLRQDSGGHVGKENWIEFDSMINLRPSWGNKSRGVDDPNIRKRIIEIVIKLVQP